MAKVQLQYGTDEEMRKLAQDIIDAQQPEIELMQSWIAANKAPDTAITDTDDAVINDKANDKEAIKETTKATS